MTVLHPCLHCHRKTDCQIKRDTLLKLRGCGITKATLRCKIPQADFPPGARVVVDAFEIILEDHDWERRMIRRTGVVRSWIASQACVVLDKDQEIQMNFKDQGSIGMLRCTSDRLTRIDGPLVDLCSCGLSTERCENGDMPSIRSGKWGCPQTLMAEAGR